MEISSIFGPQILYIFKFFFQIQQSKQTETYRASTSYVHTLKLASNRRNQRNRPKAAVDFSNPRAERTPGRFYGSEGEQTPRPHPVYEGLTTDLYP